ncbi:MAG: hypothetical protein RIA63_10030, partial [Cyclobacteriaceae bacterium]
ERLGFMNSVGPEQFLISRKGLAALDFYRLKREERFKECLSLSNSTLEFINKVFIDVIEAALKSSPNHCIYQRNLATLFKSDELISQVIENFSLLVAFRNDNAVGRHDWVSTLEANEWNGIELTAVQREIMEMLLTRDTVLLTRITENPFWRLDEQSSYAAIHELEKFGFVKAETETVIVTPVGRKYIEQASELADDAFYKPWLTLTPTQYNDFKATISSWAGQIP